MRQLRLMKNDKKVNEKYTKTKKTAFQILFNQLTIRRINQPFPSLILGSFHFFKCFISSHFTTSPYNVCQI